MKNVHIEYMFVLFAILSTAGLCLQCYKCFDNSKACNYGNKDYLGVLNCSGPNEVCATFKYETDDSDRVYTTTVRGCQPLIKEGICKQLMKTVPSKSAAKVTVKKGTFCETCDTDLCNSSSKNFGFASLPIISILALVYNLLC
ncbi:hypothetical protein NQ318_022437 [Aromia moschata]|uniref:Protein quiver n=1 Tax=Aromia moschata TaxID=1265417 RepID=A0AAV8Z7I6_9CUCU|nr:hypothetical protein NQ318_022437 [Aromia moschata]